MKKTTIIGARTIAIGVGLAFMAISALACTRDSGGPAGAGRTADDNGGVTSGTVPSSAASAPAASSGPSAATAPAVVPVATGPAASATPPAPGDLTPMMAAPPEMPVVPPSAAVLQAVGAARAKLEAVAAPLDGAKVRFVDCPEGAACTARLEAPSLTGLRDLLSGVSAQQGGIGFVAREQLDGFTGRSFVADVTLGGGENRPVPADENVLLSN
jgi:hypothetical protein